MLVVPCSADAELTLRRAQVKGLIRYFPGDERFEINEKTSLNEKQKWALNFIRKDILGEYLQTGVQFALNVAVFKLLNMNVVYPVADPGKLSDKRGNVLPDAYLMRSGSSVEDLANEIHSDLAKGILYAVDVRNGLRLPIKLFGQRQRCSVNNFDNEKEMTTSTKLSICLGVYIVDEEYKVEDEFEEQLKEDLDEEACNE